MSKQRFAMVAEIEGTQVIVGVGKCQNKKDLEDTKEINANFNNAKLKKINTSLYKSLKKILKPLPLPEPEDGGDVEAVSAEAQPATKLPKKKLPRKPRAK